MTGIHPATPEMTDAGLRAERARTGASRRAVYQVTITGRDGGPVSAAVCRWLGLPEEWPAAERHFRAAGNAGLRGHLDRLRHPGLDVFYRVAGSDGEPFGPAVRAVRCTGRWLRHDVEGRDLFVYEKPSGKNRFQVFERGAGRRGTARKRADAASLPEALGLACRLDPSAPEEILAGVETFGEDDRRLAADLIRYSRPGTRLWILPRYGEHGYQGTGQPATALGLGVIGVEALFGSELGCWVIRYRGDDGKEGTIGARAAMTADEAAARWWVLDDAGNLLSGGHHDKDRMFALSCELGGHAQLGLQTSPVTVSPAATHGVPPAASTSPPGGRGERLGDDEPGPVTLPACHGFCAACGHRGTPGDPLVIDDDGCRIHGSQTAGPAGAPAGWKALAAATAGCEPEDDGELLGWMAGEVAGMSGYGEALTAVYETCVGSVGLDPVAMAAVHDVADAAADAATAMAYARRKFASHYAEVREFVGNGGVLPYDGRWMRGGAKAACR